MTVLGRKKYLKKYWRKYYKDPEHQKEARIRALRNYWINKILSLNYSEKITKESLRKFSPSELKLKYHELDYKLNGEND